MNILDVNFELALCFDRYYQYWQQPEDKHNSVLKEAVNDIKNKMINPKPSK